MNKMRNIVPQPKFAIGDTVFYVQTDTINAKHDCPDCMGSRAWQATSPAGQSLSMDCPRCTLNHGWNSDLSLNYTKYVPRVRALTIGSVCIDTSADEPVGYMCIETGVGSGSVYRECQLHDTKEAADEDAAFQCAARQAEADKDSVAVKIKGLSGMTYFEAQRQAITEQIVAATRRRVREEIESGLPEGPHTPGVWVASGGVSADGVFSFQIDAQDLEHDYRSTAVCTGYGGLCDGWATKEQGPANVRLMAAAPELLAALQAALTVLPDSVGAFDYDAATAAIAKATQP